MEEEIKSEFQNSGFSVEAQQEEEILRKCLTFCINYKLKPSDLVSSWEVYYLNRQLSESDVRNVEMDGFLLHLQNEQKEAFFREEPGLHLYSSKDVEMILNNEDDTKEDVPSTPPDESLEHPGQINSPFRSNGHGCSSERPTHLVTPFGRRTNKFVVKFSINNVPDTENGDNGIDHETLDDDIIKRVRSCSRCSLVVHGNGPEPGCRFMYDRIEDRFNALDNRIKMFAAAICASGNYEEPADPTVASQVCASEAVCGRTWFTKLLSVSCPTHSSFYLVQYEHVRNVFAVGMISCDGEGRLNDKSIMLQCSVEHSGGQRVRLDLHNLDQFSIFPGQIVGIEGHNPSGHCFVASKLVDSVSLSVNCDLNPRPSKKQTLHQEFRSNDLPRVQEKISMIIASGPYTTTDNLMFEPLTELLAYASRKQPQMLVMLGPFVDSGHPEIKTGNTGRSFDEIFRLEVLRRLQDHVEFIGSDARVILVPSTRDANHDFVFPQPAYDNQPPNLKHQISSIPNPGTFDVNQVKVSCCTVDILRHLSGEEMSRHSANGTATDRISRLSNHILSQRRFYPLYPPAEDVPLDFSLCPEALNIEEIPDILILPSDMKYFVKVLSLAASEGEEQSKCICINPGRLAKGEGGGTFVELDYHGNADMINASVISI